MTRHKKRIARIYRYLNTRSKLKLSFAFEEYFLRFYRTSYWTNSTVNSNDASIASYGMRMTATFTSVADGRGSG